MKRRIGDVIGGCFVGVITLALLLYAVSALMGLITGEMYLPDKKGGGSTLHGAPARIVSAIILTFFAFILSAVLKVWRSRRGVRRRADVMREAGRGEDIDGDDGTRP